MVTVSFVVENDKRVAKALKDAAKKIGDLTIPLTSITQDFYQSQKAIFSLKGPGQFPDLTEKSKEQKMRKVGFVYPILKRTGRLSQSTLDPTHPEAINKIINKNTLFIGTRVPYGVFHQEGTVHMPVRKFLFIGPESGKGTGPLDGRVKRWLQIIENYTEKVLRQEVKGKS